MRACRPCDALHHGQSSGGPAATSQKWAKLPDAEGKADRKRHRGNDDGKQARAAGAVAVAKRAQTKPVSAAGCKTKALGVKRSRLREHGVSEVVKQRLRKDDGKEQYEYRCIWVGYEEADATWETEVTLKRTKHGAQKLVSAMRLLRSRRSHSPSFSPPPSVFSLTC